MQTNYKPLGNFIREVDVRNEKGEINTLLGINIDKFFMPSVANVVGTDLTRYKIVDKNQFACNRMHVGRDMRLPVAISIKEEKFIVSPAYDVFEIIDTQKLLPDYLMMWFSRREFDRNTWFYTDADVRGGLSWNTFLDMQLPVPSLEKQHEIVAEYNAVQKRINLNNKLIQKLEETAQAIYKQWFVDFEFPDEEGKPYKSNGGEMVESEMGEVPKGWRVDLINMLCEISSSKRIFEEEYCADGIPFYRGKEITLKKAGEVITDTIFISKKRYEEVIKTAGKPTYGDILMTAVGTIGSSYFVGNEDFYFKDGNVIWFKNFKKEGANYFLYDFMQREQFKSIINEITIGSTQNAITITTLGKQQIVIPSDRILLKYSIISEKLNRVINNKKNVNLLMKNLKELLLSNIANENN